MVLDRILRLLGFGAQAAKLAGDAIRAARAGQAQDAAMRIQRSAEVQAFKRRHGWEPKDEEELELWRTWGDM